MSRLTTLRLRALAVFGGRRLLAPPPPPLPMTTPSLKFHSEATCCCCAVIAPPLILRKSSSAERLSTPKHDIPRTRNTVVHVPEQNTIRCLGRYKLVGLGVQCQLRLDLKHHSESFSTLDLELAWCHPTLAAPASTLRLVPLSRRGDFQMREPPHKFVRLCKPIWEDLPTSVRPNPSSSSTWTPTMVDLRFILGEHFNESRPCPEHEQQVLEQPDGNTR